jgi:RNA polymerase sigma-70 factor (ECF subfamily)
MAARAAMTGTADDQAPPQAEFPALVAAFGPALQRLARGYEADPGRQQDLVQEILVALWQALPSFAGRASLRTWLLRVAHNVALTWLLRRRRDRLAQAVALEDDAWVRNAVHEAEGRDAAARLGRLIRALRPHDAQLILLYLEGLPHAEIAQVTGLTRENVAVKVHRIKAVLSQAFDRGGSDG